MTVGRKAWHNTATQQQPTTTQLPLKRYAAFVKDLHLGHGCALVSLQTACARARQLKTLPPTPTPRVSVLPPVPASTAVHGHQQIPFDSFLLASLLLVSLHGMRIHVFSDLSSYMFSVQCRSRSLSPSRPRHSPDTFLLLDLLLPTLFTRPCRPWFFFFLFSLLFLSFSFFFLSFS
jgi:hypothetical protein